MWNDEQQQQIHLKQRADLSCGGKPGAYEDGRWPPATMICDVLFHLTRLLASVVWNHVDLGKMVVGPLQAIQCLCDPDSARLTARRIHRN